MDRLAPLCVPDDMPPIFGIQFDKLLSGAPDVELVDILVELAADADPAADAAACRRELARLADGCRQAAPRELASGSLRQRLLAISRQLFVVEGFRGDRQTYYRAVNSYLPEVLRRRQGLPITLGLVYLLVARELGLEMFGCNSPGHFVVGAALPDEGPWYVDAFGGGEVLSLADCLARLRELVGAGQDVSRATLVPASVATIVARMLRNLKQAHCLAEDWPALARVAERLVALAPTVAEVRDLALCYLRLGRPRQSLSLLERFRARASAEDTAAIVPDVRAARRMVVELN